MHDLHEADKILKLILTKANPPAGGKKLNKVTKAKIKLGQIIEHGETIQPENLVFNIKMLAKGTLADGLEVEVEKSGGNFWELEEIEGD